MIGRFVLNGLVHANKVLGEEVFVIEDWKVIGEYIYDINGGRHQAFYSPKRDVHYKNIFVRAGERVKIEQSLKYSAQEAESLWKASQLKHVQKWTASSEAYSQYHLLFSSPNPRVFAAKIA